MKYEQFAFFNQQLAAMLQNGIPLEHGIRQLCRNMRKGAIKREFEYLYQDLSRGVPLEKALAARELPEFYCQLVTIGARSNNLSKVLTLLADYYRHLHNLFTRLHGLLFYPFMVIVVSLLLSLLMIWFCAPAMTDVYLNMAPKNATVPPLFKHAWLMFFPAIVFSGLLISMVLVWSVPRWRYQLYWRLTPFKQACLVRVSAAIALSLRGGCTLAQALALAAQMEQGSPAALDLRDWQMRVSQGEAAWEQISRNSRVFPPFFTWLLSAAQDNPYQGFVHAQEVYQEQADYYTNILINAALPVSIMFTGALLAVPLYYFATQFVALIRFLSQAA